MKIYFGGYYIIEGISIDKWMNASLLPSRIYSMSSCLNKIHPSWSNTEEGIKIMKDNLGINEQKFKEMQKEIYELFDNNIYGYDGGFYNKEKAIEFRQKYLQKIVDIKIRALGLPEKYLNEFLDNEIHEKEGSDVGLYNQLLKKEEISMGYHLLGYEILGYEFGSFHSFICNGLETDYADKLRIKFNKYGLIQNYNDVEKAAEYSNLDVGAEPVLWQPWAIYDIE